LIWIETPAGRGAILAGSITSREGSTMAWYNLFTTDYGLMSLAVIVGVIAIGLYLTKKFNDLSKQPPGEENNW
jgi:hypothetical protein